MISIYVLLFLLGGVLSAPPGCPIDVHKLTPQPLVLNPNYEIIYPPPNSGFEYNTTIPEGEIIIVSCPGSSLTLFPQTSTVLLVCDENDNFIHEDSLVSFSSLTCTSQSTGTARLTEKSCGPDAQIIEIGFEISTLRFLTVSEVCFDLNTLNPLYTRYNLSAPKQDVVPEVHPNLLIEDNQIYNLDVSIRDIYDAGNVAARINGLVGLPPNADSYSHYALQSLSASYIWEYLAISTIMPRYLSTFLQRTYSNWYQLANDEIKFVARDRLDLQVYAGTYGVATLPHEQTGEEVEIFLLEDHGRKLPVPALTWKVYHQPETRKAVVFIVVNTDRDLEKYRFCNDFSGAMDWLTPAGSTHNYSDPVQGLTYSCTYNTVMKVIPHLPELDVVDILY